MDGVVAAHAHAREVVVQKGGKFRVALNDKQALGIDCAFEESSRDGSGSGSNLEHGRTAGANARGDEA